MTRIVVLLVIAAFVLGCANPINQRTAAHYYEAGEAALARGELHDAKEVFTRALINARLGHMGDRAEAQVLCELGRVYGNLCDHIDAEKTLLEARAPNIKIFAHDPIMTLPSRAELAQLSYDIGEGRIRSISENLQVVVIGYPVQLARLNG